MKPCLAPACLEQVKYPRLLCAMHWRRLPSRIRAQITGHLMVGNDDSARILLNNHYAVRITDEHDASRSN